MFQKRTHLMWSLFDQDWDYLFKCAFCDIVAQGAHKYLKFLLCLLKAPVSASGPCSRAASCASTAGIPGTAPGGVTWLHSDLTGGDRSESWASKPSRFLGSSDSYVYLVRCAAQLNLHCLKINYAATFLKETLTMCLEKIVAHSVNLPCLCIRSIINDK